MRYIKHLVKPVTLCKAFSFFSMLGYLPGYKQREP